MSGWAQSNPASRLGAAIILACGVAVAHSWVGWMAIAIVTGGYYYFSEANWTACWRYLRPMLILCGITVLLGQGAGGRQLVALGLWEYTTADALAGAQAAGKILALMVAVAWFGVSIEATDMAHALTRLLRPLQYVGVNADDIGTAVFLAMRFLPLTISEARGLHLAQEARAMSLAKGYRALWQRLTSLTIPLMVAALRRSDALATTLVLRGYRRGQAWQHNAAPYTRLRSFPGWDVLVVALALAAASTALFT